MKKKLTSLLSLVLLVSPYVIGTGHVFANTRGIEKIQDHESQLTTSEAETLDSAEALDRSEGVESVELSDQKPSNDSPSPETGRSETEENNTTKDSSEKTDLMEKEDPKSEPDTNEISSVRTEESSTENDKTETPLDDDTDDIASGVSGTVDWRIDSEGTLHFYPGKFAEFKAGDGYAAWYSYRDSINKIVLEGEVFAGSRFEYVFAYLPNVTQIENLHF